MVCQVISLQYVKQDKMQHGLPTVVESRVAYIAVGAMYCAVYSSVGVNFANVIIFHFPVNAI
jgi:hypothetical protein